MQIGDHEAASLIDAATAQLQVIAATAGVTLVVSRADGVVRADPDRVIQTLINLVGNAIKFSPVGSTVEVAAEPTGDLVEFVVTDQGRGIPPDKLDTIFGRFEQVDSSDARDKGGSGLGLAISRSMVERQGGHIWATNSAGSGATFRFTLPRSTDGPEALATAGSVPQQVGVSSSTARPAHLDEMRTP
jgi:signal transduction histidine kinase